MKWTYKIWDFPLFSTVSTNRVEILLVGLTVLTPHRSHTLNSTFNYKIQVFDFLITIEAVIKVNCFIFVTAIDYLAIHLNV